MIRLAGILALSLLFLGAARAEALTLQPIGSFEQPTYVTSDPGDASRLFVVERKGRIQLVRGGVKTLFADLTAEVGCGADCQGERGLLSIALSPDFDASGRLFAAYANDVDGKIHVDELVAAAPDHATASGPPNPLLTIDHAEAANHNGGQLQFGPDGNLYLSTGDGGGANDQFHHAQDPSSPLGKILRLSPGPAPPYAIWSSGLRNPFRFSFDSLSGDMVIGDVGQGLREEIDFAPSPLPGVVGGSGANYGWNCREGSLAGPATDPQCAAFPTAAFSPPVFDYPHDPDPDLGGNRCAVIGGYVARDPSLGALYGHYLYADLCSGAVRALQLPTGAGERASDDCSLGLRLSDPVSFGEDAAKRLYAVEEGGQVYRLAGLPPASCPSPPEPTTTRAQLGPTFIGLRAQRRRVERGRRAFLTVWVSPCAGRRGEPVRLLRNGHANGSRFLSRACTARFVPRIRRGTSFAAVVFAQRGYAEGKSRRLKIRIAHRHRSR